MKFGKWQMAWVKGKIQRKNKKKGAVEFYYR